MCTHLPNFHETVLFDEGWLSGTLLNIGKISEDAEQLVFVATESSAMEQNYRQESVHDK